MYEQYRCFFCGYSVEPGTESVAELVSGWAIKNRILRQTDRTWRFAHRICAEAKPKDDTQGNLF